MAWIAYLRETGDFELGDSMHHREHLPNVRHFVKMFEILRIKGAITVVRGTDTNAYNIEESGGRKRLVS